MSRVIRVLVPFTVCRACHRPQEAGQGGGCACEAFTPRVDFIHPNHAVGVVLGLRQVERGRGDGLKVSGAGMDMGFWLVYTLSRALWPDGYACIGEGCPANDHSNGLREYTAGKHQHSDGGYALRQRWL